MQLSLSRDRLVVPIREVTGSIWMLENVDRQFESRQIDPRQSQVVELRFFSGLSVEETAKVLDVSERTDKRDWNVAKAWLRRELSKGGEAGARA